MRSRQRLLQKLIDRLSADGARRKRTPMPTTCGWKCGCPSRRSSPRPRSRATPDLAGGRQPHRDPEEKQALDAYRDAAAGALQAAMRAAITIRARFETLTVEDVRTEAAAKYSGKSIFPPRRAGSVRAS